MQAKDIASSFVNTQFNNCAILWKFCIRKLKLRLEIIRNRTLRVVYNEYEQNHKDLLTEHAEISIHQRHLKFLVTEVLKSVNKLNPQFMCCFFENHEIPYNLGCKSVVKLPGINTTKYEINSLKSRGAMLWNITPKNIKLFKTLPEFKENVEKTLDIIGYYRVHNYSNNCLVSSYIAPISVKLGFIVFTWIRLAFISQLCFIPKEKVRSIFIFYQVF